MSDTTRVPTGGVFPAKTCGGVNVLIRTPNNLCSPYMCQKKNCCAFTTKKVRDDYLDALSPLFIMGVKLSPITSLYAKYVANMVPVLGDLSELTVTLAVDKTHILCLDSDTQTSLQSKQNFFVGHWNLLTCTVLHCTALRSTSMLYDTLCTVLYWCHCTALLCGTLYYT